MLKEERHQKLLKVLAEKEFATVEELLALNGVTAKPGVLYRKIG